MGWGLWGWGVRALNLPLAAAVGSLQAMSGEESESGLGRGGASPLGRCTPPPARCPQDSPVSRPPEDPELDQIRQSSPLCRWRPAPAGPDPAGRSTPWLATLPAPPRVPPSLIGFRFRLPYAGHLLGVPGEGGVWRLQGQGGWRLQGSWGEGSRMPGRLSILLGSLGALGQCRPGPDSLSEGLCVWVLRAPGGGADPGGRGS